ncbi:MAG: exopolyphosphatase [Proteobacteria bacterium]|nr:exopolyphosphatase [Pseudomonadota bacterium]
MRLLTRSDFDGLVSAVFLVEKGIVDEYKFVHPKDVQDGKIEATSNDVLVNIPYVPGCGLWFDHHSSEEERLEIGKLGFEGDCRAADSDAQVIWDYYGGEKTFGERFLPLLDAVNKTDSGDLTREEIVNPQGWILLSFIMDPRTGLGRFQDYRISNYQLMEDMIHYCREKTENEILELPDIQERVMRFFDQQDLFTQMLKDNCEIKEQVIVTNLLDVETIYAGNRFLVYGIYPDQNIEIRIMWGKEKRNVVFACGHSILNRSSQTDVGNLMLKYQGGGHHKVGTCQVPIERSQKVLEELIDSIQKDG